MATNEAAADRVGSTVLEKWHLDELIGVGGMGAVYAATHRNGGRAALKFLHAELSQMREIRSRFVREGYVANRVGHPAVVRAIDDDTDESGTPFLVMELVEGETLAQRAESELLNAEELLAVAEQVLPALVAGHERGVIHRDLKPENLLVDRDGRVRILDYGIARVVNDAASDALRVHGTGTPSFMSPEQINGVEETGPLSDVYSLGATLFALATGRPPHVASTVVHLMVRITAERAPRIALLAPDLPPRVAALIDRAVARDPNDRWPSAAAMLAEVERARDELGFASSPLVLACRHGVTQPDAMFADTTGSVRAIVVNRTASASSRSMRAALLVLAFVAVGSLGVAIGASRRRPVPVAAAPTAVTTTSVTVAASPTIAPSAPSVRPMPSAVAKPAVKRPRPRSITPRPKDPHSSTR